MTCHCEYSISLLKNVGLFGNILQRDIKTFALNSLVSSLCFSQNYIVVWALGSDMEDMRFCAQTTLCLLMILIAPKGSGIAQLRYHECVKAVHILKNFLINIIFDCSKGFWRGGLERNVKLTFLVCKIDM